MGAVAGGDLYDSEGAGEFENIPHLVLGEAFQIILFHLIFGEMELEIDVERPDQDLVLEVRLLVEVPGLLRSLELECDKVILFVQDVLLHIIVDLGLLHVAEHHRVLHTLVHFLDDHMSALRQPLLQALLHFERYYYDFMMQLIILVVVAYATKLFNS